jgi:hypothetical protein
MPTTQSKKFEELAEGIICTSLCILCLIISAISIYMFSNEENRQWGMPYFILTAVMVCTTAVSFVIVVFVAVVAIGCAADWSVKSLARLLEKCSAAINVQTENQKQDQKPKFD